MSDPEILAWASHHVILLVTVALAIIGTLAGAMLPTDPTAMARYSQSHPRLAAFGKFCQRIGLDVPTLIKLGTIVLTGKIAAGSSLFGGTGSEPQKP